MAFDNKPRRAAYIVDMESSNRRIRSCWAKEARKHPQTHPEIERVRHLYLFAPRFWRAPMAQRLF
jgi:hypothetical protein